jgi:hypothetical protein
MKLVIGNKNYSSWSMRPWLLLTHFGIPFDEVQVVQVWLSTPDTRAGIAARSPSGKVPCLIDKRMNRALRVGTSAEKSWSTFYPNCRASRIRTYSLNGWASAAR